MSKCPRDETPGPQTTVHGLVTDPKTGEKVGGVVLQVAKDVQCTFCGPNEYDYDTVSTHPDGTYNLTFIPKGTGDFYLHLPQYANIYLDSRNNYSLKLGVDNKLDLYASKLVNVSVHVISNSTQNKDLNVLFYGGMVDYRDDVGPNHVDVTLQHKMPQLSSLYIKTGYYNGMALAPDTVTVVTTYTIGRKDTLITIIRP